MKMNEREEKMIIQDLTFKLNYSDNGLKKYIKKNYPYVDGRSYSKLIRLARQNSKKQQTEVAPPIDLTNDELKIWNDVWQRIERSHIEPVDHITLANYCQSKSLYYTYHNEVLNLENGGVLYSKKTGSPFTHPKVNMRNAIEKRCVEIEKLFGFNPKGRKELGLKKKAERKSAILALLNPERKSAQH